MFEQFIHQVPISVWSIIFTEWCDIQVLVQTTTVSKKIRQLMDEVMSWKINTMYPRIYTMHSQKCPSKLLLYFLVFSRDPAWPMNRPWLVYAYDVAHILKRVRHKTMCPGLTVEGDAVGDIFSSARATATSFKVYRNIVSYYPIVLFAKD